MADKSVDLYTSFTDTDLPDTVVAVSLVIDMADPDRLQIDVDCANVENIQELIKALNLVTGSFQNYLDKEHEGKVE